MLSLVPSNLPNARTYTAFKLLEFTKHMNTLLNRMRLSFFAIIFGVIIVIRMIIASHVCLRGAYRERISDIIQCLIVSGALAASNRINLRFKFCSSRLSVTACLITFRRLGA